jgi:transcriptional regulator with XRE-family HTH domain
LLAKNAYIWYDLRAMALTDDEKEVRKKVIGMAVRLLRDHLGLSQAQFARLLDEQADPMGVSKWERATVTPHPETREKLADIARKNDRPDLEAAFRDPVMNWKGTLPGNARYVSDLITLLEICAINQHIAGLDDREDDFWYQALDQMAALVRDRIVEKARKGVRPLLVNDAQRQYWFSLMEELGIAGSKGGQRTGKRHETGKKAR